MRNRSANDRIRSPLRQINMAEEHKFEGTQNTTTTVAEVPACDPSDFTEIFSWGSDRHGQLGLGKQMSQGKAMHTVPRFCSYNIPIMQIACGAKHAVFITSKFQIFGRPLSFHSPISLLLYGQ